MSDAVLYVTSWLESWRIVLAAAAREAAGEDEAGQGMVEYGLILALVAIAAIVALGFLSGGIQNAFLSTGSAVKATPVRVATPTP